MPLAPPSGMADLLFPESVRHRELGRRLTDCFARYGYDLVATPAFEHAEVLERGLDAVDRRDLLRFVEPDTGEVALLRPDITPQIARIVATRLADRPPPFRLCYWGTVIRRRRGRARKQRQISQAGVECIGFRGPEADVEVIAVASKACETSGLDAFRIELGHVHIGRAALESVPEPARPAVVEAVVQKDRYALEALLREARVPVKERATLLSLVDLYGDATVIRRARKSMKSAVAQTALDELARVAERLGEVGLGARVGVDLGELRGQAYYTGVSFTVLAEGPGEPVGAGGRYDGLLARFGHPAPATGFALDLGNLEWALSHAGHPVLAATPIRVALGRGSSLDPWAEELRGRDVMVARLESDAVRDAFAFARAWAYDAFLVEGKPGPRAVRMSDEASRAFSTPAQVDEFLQWARATGSRSED